MVSETLRADLEGRLARLADAGLSRRLTEPHGVDFASNDYLGLAASGELRSAFETRLKEVKSLGAPASRLLRGHLAQHAALEARLAVFKGSAAALLFANGYMANLAVLTALVQPEDRVISDALNHASLIDGIRLCRCAKEVVPHLDLAAVEAALRRPHASGRTFVVVESLFSMDGDQAPLVPLADLCERFHAGLIIDDSHAVGLYGARASGLSECAGVVERATAVVTTCGKGLGVFGAFVACSALVREVLVQTARPFIFTTAPAPYMLAAIEAALDVVAAAPKRGQRALRLATTLRERLRAAGLNCFNSSGGPIVPVLAGSNEAALAAAEMIQQAGYDVRAIRPPTVAPGTARLRISVHADHTVDQIVGLGDAVIAALRCEGLRVGVG